MIFNVWTFVFEVINFLVLVYVLRRLLYRPLHAAIEQRREANAQAQADAEQARREATALQQQLNERLAALEGQGQELIRKAREQADLQRKATQAEAEQLVQRRHQELVQQLERDRAEARESLRSELVQSAVALAERFVHEAASKSLQEQLAVRLAEELRGTPEEDRLRLRGELQADDAAVVETAADLNGEILQSLDGALALLVGRSVSLSVQTRPEMLAGLRLRLGGHVWDATLRGGLGEAAPLSSGSVAS